MTLSHDTIFSIQTQSRGDPCGRPDAIICEKQVQKNKNKKIDSQMP